MNIVYPVVICDGFLDIENSIFGDECCVWQGYVTNHNKPNKTNYVNFFFNKKKRSLHRILYYNFVGPLSSDHYLRYTCKNCGVCCNINHLQKFKYNNTLKTPEDKPEQQFSVNKTSTRVLFD